MKFFQIKTLVFFVLVFIFAGLFKFIQLYEKSTNPFFEKPEYVLFYIYGDQKEKILFIGVLFLSNATRKVSFLTIYPSLLMDVDGKQVDVQELFNLYSHSKILLIFSDLLKLPIKHHISLSLDSLGEIIHLLEGISVYVPFFNRSFGENLPQEPFLLDEILLKEFLHPDSVENSLSLSVIHISRYYSLILSLSNEFKIKEDLFKSKKIRDIILEKFYTTLTFNELQKLFDYFIDIDEKVIPMFTKVGLKLKENQFILDIEKTKKYVKNCLQHLYNVDEYKEGQFLNLIVHNGTNYSGLAKSFRGFLVSKGIQVFEFSNADHAEYENSYLINVGGNIKDEIYLSKLLGIKNIYYGINQEYLADMVLILGKDYKNLQYE